MGLYFSWNGVGKFNHRGKQAVNVPSSLKYAKLRCGFFVYSDFEGMVEEFMTRAV